MVALGRVELPTFGLGNRCSIHLSYRATRCNRRDCLSLQQPHGPPKLTGLVQLSFDRARFLVEHHNGIDTRSA
jgi:hypothetical protein